MLVRLAKGRIVSKGLEVSHETRRRKRPAISWLGDSMSGCMAHCAQRDEILLNIASQPTARADVVDLKILRYAAVLTAPPVAREHLASEPAVRIGLKP